jgi:AraC-like DNA-binding protein
LLAFIALPFTDYTQTIIALGSLSQIIYLLISVTLLTRYRVSSHAVRSDADSIQLSWMFKALLVFSLLIVTDLIRMNVQHLVSHDLKTGWYLINELLTLLVFSFLAFKVLTQPTLFKGMTEYEAQIEEIGSTNEREEQVWAEQVFAAIDIEITQQTLFKKPRLSINELSVITGFKLKDISWAINKVAKRNFNDYINYLRVQEVTQNLEGDMPSSNILDTALLSGFNSKSTFNAVFKREIGMTPTQYLKKVLTNKVQG